MIGTGLAILGAGLLGAGASAYGANKAASTQADAANQAAAIQAKGQADALGFQKDVYGSQLANFADASNYAKSNFGFAKDNFGETKGNLQPFVNNGIAASNKLANGMNGDLSTFYNSPDYQFALKGGSEALDNSAAAKGGALSGNQIRAQTEYGSGLATQNLQSYFQRLSGIAGQGIQAGGMLGQYGTSLGQTGASLGLGLAQTGAALGNGVVGPNASTNIAGSNNVAQSTMAAGTADASGTLGMVKGINSGLSSLSLYNQMGKSSYAGGSPLSSYNPNQIGGIY